MRYWNERVTGAQVTDIVDDVERALYTEIINKCKASRMHTRLQDNNGWLLIITDNVNERTSKQKLTIYRQKLDIIFASRVKVRDGTWEGSNYGVPIADPELIPKLSTQLYILFGVRI